MVVVVVVVVVSVEVVDEVVVEEEVVDEEVVDVEVVDEEVVVDVWVNIWGGFVFEAFSRFANGKTIAKIREIKITMHKTMIT